MRRDADEEGGVGHGGAGAGASRHREAAAGASARGAARAASRQHSALCACANLREVSRAAAVGGDLRQALEPRQHAPPFSAAPASRLGTSVPRQAEAPESCPVPSTDQVS